MIKKTVFLASLLASAYVAPTAADSNFYRSGFFTGAHAGASIGSGKFDGVFDLDLAQIGVSPSSVSEKARKTSALFGIFGGYRHIFNEGYTLGVDISANLLANDEMKKELNHSPGGVPFSFVNKLHRQYNIIPSVSFGKVICGRFHAYVGLGLAVSRFRQTVVDLDFNAPPSVTHRASQTKLGFVPTVGVEYAVTPNISVLGNVSYEIYGKMRKNFELGRIGVLTPTYASSIKPRYLTLKLGAAYRF